MTIGMQKPPPDSHIPGHVLPSPSTGEAIRDSSITRVYWGTALLLILLSIALLLHFMSLDERIIHEIKAWGQNSFSIEDRGAETRWLFFLLTTTLVMIGIPRLIFFTASGFLFGFAEGLSISLAASVLGSFFTFLAVRRFLRRAVSPRISRHPKIARLVDSSLSSPVIASLRMLPASNFLISTGLAIGQTKSSSFLLGTLIGYLPQGLIVTAIGNGFAATDPLVQFSYFAMALIVFFGVIVVISKLRHRAQTNSATRT